MPRGLARKSIYAGTGATGTSAYSKRLASLARSAGVSKSRMAMPFPPSKAVNVRTAGFTNIENKFKDFALNGTAITQTWAGGELDDPTAMALSAVQQGDGESQRDGRVFTINSVHLSGNIAQTSLESQTVPISDSIVRLALVWDTQSNNAQLNAEDVMLPIGTNRDIHSFRNLQFSKRFIVLKDMKIRVPAAQTSTNEGAVNLFANPVVLVNFKMNKSFKKGIKVRCNATTAVVTSVTDNSLHLIGCSNASTNTITYTSRVRFTG